MDKVIVIGSKGTAICIAEQIIDARQRFGAAVEFLGWAIDEPPIGSLVNGYPVLCKPVETKHYPERDVKFLFALYKPERMRERTALLKSYDIPAEKYFTFVHPTAALMPSVSLGNGSIVLAHSVVHSNSRIGNFSIINSQVMIEHDTQIDDNCFVAAAACIGSEVRIKQGAFIGLNATIREQIQIGDFAFVGMGSNVVSDIQPGQIAYGNPARAVTREKE